MTSAAPPPPAPWSGQPAIVQTRGSSPGRLLVLFVVALLVVVGIGAVIALVLSPPAQEANCPDPTVPCERPPENPTLQPGTTAVAASSTPRATIFRPASPLPTFGATPQATGIVPPTPGPSIAPASQPPGGTATPAAPVIPTPALAFPVPTPRAASNAARLAAGALWTSEAHGFAFEYDGQIWAVRDEGTSGVFLIAARGNVGLTIVGYPAGEVSSRDALQREVDRLKDVIIGFTEEPDAAKQLPGLPIIGYEPGVGGVYAGTINTPQGPGPNVSIALLAASDGQVTILVNVTTVDSLREPAFHAVDSILNTVRWPGRPE